MELSESAYESQKYNATCAALRSDRYRYGLEQGCSIGVLSTRLAARCNRFLGVDLAATAVEQAARRLSPIPVASAIVAHIPTEWPDGQFDLIILSEVIYYLNLTDINLLTIKIAATAMPGAECVLVNWCGHTDTHFTGLGARVAFCDALAKVTNFQTKQNCGTDDYDHVTLLLD